MSDTPTRILGDDAPDIESTGERLGRYPVTGRLGEGGMGDVLLVHDEMIGRQVGAKVVRVDSPEALARFAREARITGQLEHPNIVPVYEIGRTESGRPYFTMKRIEGQTLGELLTRDGPSLVLLLGVFLKVCDAISFAHSRGVIHRDLKPDNVMVGAYGEVIVCDWGLARLVDGEELPAAERPSVTLDPSDTSHTLDGSVMGTPAYMPPEQALGYMDRLDERSDIYSLGAILYELLVGQPPFGGDEILDVLLAVVEDGIARPSSRAAVPWELEAVVVKAMQRDSEQRYGTVAELQRDVQAYLEGRTLGAARYGLHQRLAKWIARHKIAALVGMIVVLLVAGLFLSRGLQEATRQKEIARRKTLQAQRRKRPARHRAEPAASKAAVLKRREQEVRHALPHLQQARDAFHEADCMLYVPTFSSARRMRRAFGRARRAIERAWKIAPHMRELRLLRAQLLVEYHKYDEALALLDWRGVEPRLMRVHLMFRRLRRVRGHRRAMVDRARGGHKFSKPPPMTPAHERMFAELERALAALREVAPKHPTLGWMPGLIALARGDHEAANRRLGTLTLERFADWPYIHYRVEALYQSYAITDALALVEEALEGQPNNVNLLRWRAMILRAKREHARAITDWTRVLEIQPENVDALLSRGLAHRDAGNLDAALADYTTLIDAGKMGATPYGNRALVHKQRGELAAAMRDIEQAIARSVAPDRGLFYGTRASIKQKQGDATGAIEDYTRAVTDDPELAPAFNNRGSIHRRQQRWKAAIADFTRALAIDADYPHALINRAQCYIQTREFDKAMQDVHTLLAIAKNYGPPYQIMAAVHLAQGKQAEALDAYARGIRAVPSYPLLYLMRADLHLKMGKHALARADCQAFLRIAPRHQYAGVARKMLAGLNDK